MKITSTLTLWFGLAAVLAVPGFREPATAQTVAQTKPQKTSNKQADTSTPPSSQDIANAKSQGLVWVNTSSRVYHKSGEFYGKTKHGKFMTEQDAQKQGFRAAKEPASAKTPSHKPDQSGIDGSENTHASTPPKR